MWVNQKKIENIFILNFYKNKVYIYSHKYYNIGINIYSKKGIIMVTRNLMLNQLDRSLDPWKKANSNYMRPKVGWIKTIRNALGITAEQLAKRLGVTRRRIVQLESSEIDGAVTLHTMKAAADAMNCEFVYAIVAKTSLKNILETRAKHIAIERMKHVSHSMSLESQATSKQAQQEQLEELIKNLLEGSPKKLWEE
jgi:predicted DNA-binding mobile mystery protein A